LTTDEARALAELMQATVEDGTGSFLQDVPGEPIGAKTGTAEYGAADTAGTHGWMVAIQGDLAVAVFVEDGESGSAIAGPLLEEFLRAASTP
jgi:cell division protein FtsI/penicillin-binding protein 2